MKICFICNEYPPVQCGGIGVFVKELAMDLVEKGHVIFAVGVYNGIKKDLEEIVDGVNVVRLRASAGLFSFYRNRRKLYYYVKALVQSNQIDLIEAPDFEGMLAFWSKLSCKIIVRLHGSHCYFARELNQKPSMVLKKLEALSISKASTIVGCSEYVINRTKTIFPIEGIVSTVIYNSVKYYLNVQSNKERRDIVFCGSLIEKKGIIELIKAWNLVWKRFPQICLHIIGKDGVVNGVSMRQYLSSLMKDGMRSSVVFYGHVGKERIMRFYTEALLGVFPSHAEAFALVPMEAMSVGCPVIYSNTTSGQELIEDGVDGVLCDPYNYKDIAVKIISLLNDKKSLEMLGQAGRKKIARNFNRNLILQKNLKLYEKLLYK